MRWGAYAPPLKKASVTAMHSPFRPALTGRRPGAEIARLAAETNGKEWIDEDFQLLCALALAGCGGGGAGALSNVRDAVSGESDPVMAETALLADLELTQGLLRSAPNDQALLDLAASGFAIEAELFLEPRLAATADRESPEAKTLAARLLDYRTRALAFARSSLDAQAPKLAAALDGNLGELGAGLVPEEAQDARSDDDLGVGGRPARARRQSPGGGAAPAARALMKQVRTQNAALGFGTPALFFAMDYTMAPADGGQDLAKAQEMFDEANKQAGGKSLLTRYYEGRFLCAAKHDRECFDRILGEVAGGDPNGLPDRRLANTIARDQAKAALEHQVMGAPAPATP